MNSFFFFSLCSLCSGPLDFKCSENRPSGNFELLIPAIYNNIYTYGYRITRSGYPVSGRIYKNCPKRIGGIRLKSIELLFSAEISGPATILRVRASSSRSNDSGVGPELPNSPGAVIADTTEGLGGSGFYTEFITDNR